MAGLGRLRRFLRECDGPLTFRVVRCLPCGSDVMESPGFGRQASDKP